MKELEEVWNAVIKEAYAKSGGHATEFDEVILAVNYKRRGVYYVFFFPPSALRLLLSF